MTTMTRLIELLWPPARHRAAACLLRRSWGDVVEQERRAVYGMARNHPERLTGTLPPRAEAWLNQVAAALWPGGESAGEDW